LAPLLEGEPDISPHPTAGSRTELDEILSTVEAVFVPRGQGISAWADNPEFKSAVEFFNRFNAFGTADRSGLTLEFPFGDETTMLRVTTTDDHPQLGSGLLMRLSLPSALSAELCLEIALDLNRLEKVDFVRAPLFGSWCIDAIDKGFLLVFVSFRPNLLRVATIS
jgi:hypothetical protein